MLYSINQPSCCAVGAADAIATSEMAMAWPWDPASRRHSVICSSIPNADIEYDQRVHAGAKLVIELAELNDLLSVRHVTLR